MKSYIATNKAIPDIPEISTYKNDEKARKTLEIFEAGRAGHINYNYSHYGFDFLDIVGLL